MSNRVYATTFCNFGHDMVTGEPINHECDILSSVQLHIEHAYGANAVEGSMTDFEDEELEAMEYEDTFTLAELFDECVREGGFGEQCVTQTESGGQCCHYRGHPGECEE